jgi:hypothetical protein
VLEINVSPKYGIRAPECLCRLGLIRTVGNVKKTFEMFPHAKVEVCMKYAYDVRFTSTERWNFIGIRVF